MSRTTRWTTAASRARSPKGEYGGGTVMLWDEGTWEPVGDPDAGHGQGRAEVDPPRRAPEGQVRAGRACKPRKGERSKHENWLLIKERDEYAGPEKKPIIERALTSVKTGRTMEEIAAGNVEWTKSGRHFKERPMAMTPARGPRRSARSGRGRQGEGRLRATPPRRGAARRSSSRRSWRRSSRSRPRATDWLHEIKFDGYRLARGGRRRAGDRLHAQGPRLERALPQPHPAARRSAVHVGAARRRSGGDGRATGAAISARCRSRSAMRRARARAVASRITPSTSCSSTARTSARCR